MRRGLCWLAVFGLGMLAAGGRAFGGDLSGEVLRAIADYPANRAPVARLREAGPAALDELFVLRGQLTASLNKLLAVPAKVQDATEIASLQRRLDRLDEIIDQVGMQKYCSRSRLYWYTDLDKAKEAARASGKPILSLRMLGNLNEEFSCANSRFFRTTLYANEEISKTLRENFVLHWKSVRPVPKVTIDFGDGRKLERTLTGNSIHYILTPDGDVVEALPGLYGPQAFLKKINGGVSLARQVAALGPQERAQALADYHSRQYSQLGAEFERDMAQISRNAAISGRLSPAALQQQGAREAKAAAPPRADVAGALARPKGDIERPLVAAALPLATSPDQVQDDALWLAIAALHADDAQLDVASRDLIRGENPTAAVAGRLAITKRVVEDPMLRLVRSLQDTIALDGVRNEYQLHRRIHQWLADGGYRPDIDKLNERVYAEVFLTPSTDPWLGLAPADVYTALPNGGVVKNGK